MLCSARQFLRTIPLVSVAFAAAIASFPNNANAQDAQPVPAPPTETTQPLTIPETTTAASAAEVPVDAQPSTTPPPVPTSVPEIPVESTTTSSTLGPTATDDPAQEEESQGAYSSQPPFVPDSVDPAKVEAARQKLEHANRSLTEAAQLIEARSESLDSINAQVDELSADSSELINQSAELRNNVQEIAMANFRNPSLGYPRTDIADASEAMVYRRLVRFVTTRSGEMADQFDALNGQLTDDERELVAETARLSGERDQAQILYDERVNAVEQAEIELATYEAAGEFFIRDAVFPVADYKRPLIDSYGFDRARGTADSHWHEGIDIFGPIGGELYAAETGVITNVGSGRLGGLVISLQGDSGSRWYYAHLDSFAAGLVEGQVVQAGDVIGYLGDSGNARGTDPHLHLEIHPPDIRVINPYPQLSVLADRERAATEQRQIDGSATPENESIS